MSTRARKYQDDRSLSPKTVGPAHAHRYGRAGTGCDRTIGSDNMFIGFGGYIGRLRNEKGLSFRQLGQLADIDQAYIHRLEGGEKKDPSDDIVNSLIRVLRPGKRKARIVRFLLSTP